MLKANENLVGALWVVSKHVLCSKTHRVFYPILLCPDSSRVDCSLSPVICLHDNAVRIHTETGYLAPLIGRIASGYHSISKSTETLPYCYNMYYVLRESGESKTSKPVAVWVSSVYLAPLYRRYSYIVRNVLFTMRSCVCTKMICTS